MSHITFNDIFGPKIVPTTLTTISQDRTTGTSSHEEANLKSLDQGRSAFSLETASFYSRDFLFDPIPPLQDSQRQRTLLEQRRRMTGAMIRAKNERDPFTSAREEEDLSSSEQEEYIPFLNECNSGTSKSIQNKEERTHLEQLVQQEGNDGNILDSSKYKAGPEAKPKSSRKRRPTSPEMTDASDPSAKRRATKHWNFNEEKDSDLTLIKKSVLPNPSLVLSPTRIHIPTLHRITCGRDDSSHYHPTDLFADVPQRLSNTSRYRGHFSGAKPIYDVEEFLSQCGELGFLVFKNYQCATKHNVANPNNRDTLASDSISIVSIKLQELISRIAECPLIGVNGDATKNHGYSSTHPVINEFEIPSPYNFLFHHRAQLLDEVYSHTLEDSISTPDSVITALLQCLEENQGDVFREADELFKRGQTTVQHLQRLFRPNEVVIARLNNVYSAYVLRDWPSINQDSSWSLPCWSWGYDGSFFSRKATNLTLHYQLGEVTRITDLRVFPLRFASDDLKNELIKRGKHFWGMRYKHYVSYNGWDFKREEFYVHQFPPTL